MTKNVAVVHDGCVDNPGGAAKVSVELARILDADMYIGRTNVMDWYTERVSGVPTLYAGFANKLPRTFRDMYVSYRSGKLHLPEYDLVVTSGVPAKFYQPESFQRHVHYTHHPPLRYAQWLGRDTLSGVRGNLRYCVRKAGMYLDWLEMQRVETILANSPTTAERIRRHYRREAEVVQPPVAFSDADVIGTEDREEYLLYAGRFGERKRLPMLVRAIGQTDAKLLLVGDGPLRSELEQLVADTGADVEFRGFVSEDTLEELMRYAKAGLFFAEEEDFGMTVAELLCWGTPMIVADEPNPARMVDPAFGEVVEPSSEALVRAIEGFDPTQYDPRSIAESARERYGAERFETRIRSLLSAEPHSAE